LSLRKSAINLSDTDSYRDCERFFLFLADFRRFKTAEYRGKRQTLNFKR